MMQFFRFTFWLLFVLGVEACGVSNPAPGDPYPEDFVYDVYGGGQFRLADFKGKKAVLIANHIVDDPDVSYLPDPFKRLKQLQAEYRDRLAIAIMPELAHHRRQDRALWEATSRNVYELLSPGDLPVLIETQGAGGSQAGHADHSLYRALNPENLLAWWPMVLIDKEGRIAWTSKNPETANAEHMFYETDIREAVVKLVDPEGYRQWIEEVPRDFVRQDSPWGALEIEDFERYRDMGDFHVSTAWTNHPPRDTYKGELSEFPARTGYRALAVYHAQRTGYVFGYPFYYGFRDRGYGTWAHHSFEGPPRVGTLVFFFGAFNRAAKINYGIHKGRGFAFQLEGEEENRVWLRFGRIGQHPPHGPDDEIAGDIETDVRWNPSEGWNRISFHVDPLSGTKVFLEEQLLAEVPGIKGITGILFQAGWFCSVDDIVMIPQEIPVNQLDEVVQWVDGHALDRLHVTPLEREHQIRQQATGSQSHPKTLRVNWGSSQAHLDEQGRQWHPDQPWMRGSYGTLDGGVFAYPDNQPVAGSDADIYRTVRYSNARLRFTAPKGLYTLRVYFARPFHWIGTGIPEERVEMEIEPDGEMRDVWVVDTPYREAAVFEKRNIRVEDGVLDLRFILGSLGHVAATELIQDSVYPGEPEGIPDFRSVSQAAGTDETR